MVTNQEMLGEQLRGAAPRAAFAFLRVFLGAMWIYELARGVPWAIPAGIAGGLLLIGAFTPLAAALGTALSIYVLGIAGAPTAWGTWLWLYWLLILMHLEVIATRAGRAAGVDGVLARWRPRWPIW